ncbi:MAG: hypothetical protein A2V50_01620 [Bacteroidetes bacterium RBG_19FT_COMBO_42_10]|nr:MAG: hypothetical protein A2V50_01620 [Bacteroidetes bacterium RBG_19FT_COMBO_42_10]
MKKLLLFLFICLFLDSCEKEYCWRCEISSKITGAVIKTEEYCGKTEKEIAEIEKELIETSVYTKKCVRYLK